MIACGRIPVMIRTISVDSNAAHTTTLLDDPRNPSTTNNITISWITSSGYSKYVPKE